MAATETERGPGEFRLHDNFVQMPRWVLDTILPINGLPATYFRVLVYLIRKLVGWGKLKDDVPLSQIELDANVSRRDACAALRFWSEIGIFRVSPTGKLGSNRIRIAADLTTEDTWVKAEKRIRDWVVERNTERMERKHAELVTQRNPRFALI